MSVRFRNFLIAAMLAATTGEAAAQSLDRPTLSVVDRGFYRVTVRVQAGPSGAPGGFWIDWMTREEFDLHGWPFGPTGTYTEYCDFDGVPTLNVSPSGAPAFNLGPNEWIDVQLGDLFDETAVFATYADGLQPGTELVIRAHAEGDATHFDGPHSTNLFVSTTLAECTQGFWKTHPEVWPLGCLPMTLGNVSYTQAELLSILNTPAAGNGLIFMAHQLITAKLNQCNGSNLSAVSTTVNSCDAAIGNLVIPPIGNGYLHPSQCTADTETLDQYNNGLIPGAANCPVPTVRSTWSAVKALY